MKCRTGSIREIQRQMVSDGIRVSEYALRQWVKSGILPVVYSGNKALISYDKVLSVLDIPVSNAIFDT